MNSNDLDILKNFITQCKDILAIRPKPDYMPEKDQEPFASDIFGLCLAVDIANEDLITKYPLLSDLLELAANLEWSNVPNTTIAWRHIRELVNELDSQINT